MQACVVQKYKPPLVIGRRGEKLQDGELLSGFVRVWSRTWAGDFKFLVLDPALLPWLKLPVT